MDFGPRTPTVTQGVLRYFFSTMSDGIRGLIGLAMIVGAVALFAINRGPIGTCVAVLGVALLLINYRHSRREGT